MKSAQDRVPRMTEEEIAGFQAAGAYLVSCLLTIDKQMASHALNDPEWEVLRGQKSGCERRAASFLLDAEIGRQRNADGN